MKKAPVKTEWGGNVNIFTIEKSGFIKTRHECDILWCIYCEVNISGVLRLSVVMQIPILVVNTLYVFLFFFTGGVILRVSCKCSICLDNYCQKKCHRNPSSVMFLGGPFSLLHSGICGCLWSSMLFFV